MKLKNIFGLLVFIVILFFAYQFFIKGEINIGPINIDKISLPGSSVSYTDVPGQSILSGAERDEFTEADILDEGVEDSVYTMSISYPVIPEAFADAAVYEMVKVAEMLEKEGSSASEVVVNFLYIDEPLYQLSSPVSTLLSENPISDVEIQDIRNLDFKIESESWVFNMFVDVVHYDEDSIHIQIDPRQESVEDFVNELNTVSLIVVDAAPFADSIVYYLDNQTITLSSDAVIDYHKGEISLEELYSSNHQADSGYPNTDDDENTNQDTDDYDADPTPIGSDDDYQEYIEAYNKLTDLMSQGKGDTPEAQEAYQEYKEKKQAYEDSIK